MSTSRRDFLKLVAGTGLLLAGGSEANTEFEFDPAGSYGNMFEVTVEDLTILKEEDLTMEDVYLELKLDALKYIPPEHMDKVQYQTIAPSITVADPFAEKGYATWKYGSESVIG